MSQIYNVKKPYYVERFDSGVMTVVMMAEGANYRTYSYSLILGPSREKLAVWAKAYAPNVQIIRAVRSFINQDAGQQ
jgi:hypothetical protein